MSSGLVSDLRAAVGPDNTLTDADVLSSYVRDWTGRFTGPAAAVVRPADTFQVAAVLAACVEHSVPAIPQGGNTGLVGGSVPGRSGCPPVVVSMTRMSTVGDVDRRSAQVTVDAGATLGTVQASARAAGLQFPVDLAARDSATIGGMVATNAGGLHVLRYGAMRSQVLGLEAVLGDGSVVSRLSGLVKDNTGYDLSQLLVGSEGTLGVVTKVRLRLAPATPERVVALLGLSDTAQAVDVVAGLRQSADGLSAAEIFYGDGLDAVLAHSGLPAPFGRRWPVYLLVECAGRRSPLDSLAEALGDLPLEDDATAVADDPSGMERLWAYRERHTEAVNALGVPHKLDVTVPIEALAGFERDVRATVEAAAPGSRLVLFGHVGDGNLHVNVVGPDPDDEAVDDAVLRLATDRGGSISAEHGIGRAKVAWLGLSRSEAEMSAMRAVKAALDPQGVLNPGVLLA
ncbi:MAG TPA: FAD-binding oxidoreductase [Acidimicrobiales bacterium]|nr:FAD-binding oxidoreductase [Acidimicrobiales bacterium]